MTDLPFLVLLHRYFFFLWLFQDVNRGSRFQRAAAWRHNQAQAQWLPTYMRRWVVMGLVLYGLGAVIELVLAMPVMSALFYTPGVLSVPVTVVLGVAWLGLRRLPVPV
ncbi:MAG: hypothetical protein H0W48_12710 [Methylibium sp.]|nr:hypothetical protein [Methylibium sp.]